MSVTSIPPSPVVSAKPYAEDSGSRHNAAAALIARSSVAGVTILLLAAATPPQGQQVDARV